MHRYIICDIKYRVVWYNIYIMVDLSIIIYRYLLFIKLAKCKIYYLYTFHYLIINILIRSRARVFLRTNIP